jgi:thiamine-phosphate pyrophosphorylase
VRPLPSLIATTDRATLGDVDLVAWCRVLAAAGIGAVWLRERDLADGALLRLARAVRRALPAPALVLVSARPDVAVAAEADGVHLPAAGLPIAPLRRRWGRRLLIGRSTHSRAEVARAKADGADYVTFGPVYATPSKAPFGPPRGVGELASAARLGVAAFALGGVTRERLGEVAAAGAAGAAGIRLFQDPSGLEALVAEARRLFPGAAAGAAA